MPELQLQALEARMVKSLALANPWDQPPKVFSEDFAWSMRRFNRLVEAKVRRRRWQPELQARLRTHR